MDESVERYVVMNSGSTCYFFAEKSSARLNASPKESFWRDFSRAGKKPPGNNYRNSPGHVD